MHLLAGRIETRKAGEQGKEETWTDLLPASFVAVRTNRNDVNLQSCSLSSKNPTSSLEIQAISGSHHEVDTQLSWFRSPTVPRACPHMLVPASAA